MRGRATLLGAVLVAVYACSPSEPPDEPCCGPTPTPDPCAPSASPPAALIGSPVRLNASLVDGCSFGTTQGTVRFGFQEVLVTSWTDDAIDLVVPTERWPMTIGVFVDRDDGTTVNTNFSVLAPEVVYANAHAPGGNAVAAFDLAGPIAGSPFPTGGTAASRATTPRSILTYTVGNVDAFRKYVFAANASSIAVLAEDGLTGALVPVAGSPFPSGAGTGGLWIEPTAGGLRLLSASCDSGDVRIFTVSSNALLTEMDDSPFATTSTCPTWIFGVPGATDDERFIYAAGTSGRFDAFTLSVGTDGVLSPAPAESFDLPLPIHDVEPYLGIERWHAFATHRSPAVFGTGGIFEVNFDSAGSFLDYGFVASVRGGAAVVPTGGDIGLTLGAAAAILCEGGLHTLAILGDDDTGDLGFQALPFVSEGGTIADVADAFGEVVSRYAITDRGVNAIHFLQGATLETYAMGTGSGGQPAGIAW